MKRLDKNNGLLAIHFSTLLFGLAGIFGKLIDLNPIIIVLGRVFFATCFLILLLLYKKEKLTLSNKKDYFSLLVLGILLAIHWITFFQAIQISTVAIGLLTFSTFPIFTTFLEPIISKEKLKYKNIILALITFGGVALVIPDIDIANNITIGAFYGILSGLTFSIISVLNKKYVKKYSSIKIAFYQDFSATIILIPFLFFLNPVFNQSNLVLLLVLGVVFTGIAHTLYINGLITVKAQVASIISSLEPVYGIILAILIINEIPSVRTIFGGVIILLSATYVSLTK